ncbi:hypothetical protein T484DRAFT_2021852 [Baffinella frigidus]|nr:hypothetical protein T484DRAFT_2021852 [Cryptophyta sp. CCMP2293]
MTVQSKSTSAGKDSDTLAYISFVRRASRGDDPSFDKLLSSANTATTREKSAVSANSTAIGRCTSSIGRRGSVLVSPLASDLHRLLYTSPPSTDLPESPSSCSGSVREWQQGRSARRQAAMRPLAKNSIVSLYFSEELRLQLSRSNSTTPKPGSAAKPPLAAVARSAAANPPKTPSSPSRDLSSFATRASSLPESQPRPEVSSARALSPKSSNVATPAPVRRSSSTCALSTMRKWSSMPTTGTKVVTFATMLDVREFAPIARRT